MAGANRPSLVDCEIDQNGSSGERLLELDDVTVEFRTPHGTVRAVDRVDLTVERGETVALVGESGSGKSVMSLAVMRLLDETTARTVGKRIAFRRRDNSVTDLLALPDSDMPGVRGNEIAMIFQEPMTSLNPVHTIGAQIAEVLTIHCGLSHRTALARVAGMLARVGIPDSQRRLTSYPHELSGGMRQRVMIAMALACDPLLLIADEPTTALDVTIQAQVLELFRSMRGASQLSMLFITHDLGVVAEVANRVYIMYSGQVVESGDVATILKRSRHPYTRGLIASVPRVDRPVESGKRFHSIGGRAPEPWNMPRGCRFQARCAEAVGGVCDVGPPLLESIGPQHAVRCFRHVELSGEENA